MAYNLGKQFEYQFRRDLQKIKDAFIYRLPDQQNGYVGSSQNPCDFLFYKKPYFYLLECKSIKGNTFPLANLTQYNKLIQFVNITGLGCGVVLWFTEHDRILYIPIKTIKLLADRKYKSVNINKLDQLEEKYIEVPVNKKRIMCEGDYQFLEQGVEFTYDYT